MVRDWLESIKIYKDKRIILLTMLGFSSGYPFMLINGTLNLWLGELGIAMAAIGFITLVKLPYSFRFLWSPFLDKFSAPIFGKLGRRKSWALFTQILLIVAIIFLSQTDPTKNVYVTVAVCTIIALLSASQDVVIDAFRIEMLEEDEQGAGAASYILGYRLGIIFSTALTITLAATLGWEMAYIITAFGALVGVIAVLMSKEPVFKPEKFISYNHFMKTTFIEPFIDFMKKKDWMLILLFIMLYRLSDSYIGPMAMPFYHQMGFSKSEIVQIINLYGVAMTIIGGIVGGVLVMKIGINKSLIWCGILTGLSNLFYAYLAQNGKSIDWLIITISFENLSGGMANAVFVAYMSGLCNIAFTATQYSVLTSFMSISRDVVASTSGVMVETIGWVNFFIVTSLMVIPSLLLLIYMLKSYSSEIIKTKE
jgi:PAT family beta-lactamase induction signal transducer AmpG